MISIRQSVNELDRLAELQKATATNYQLAIRASSEYAVELDSICVATFREHLAALQSSLEQASQPDHFHAIQSSFRGELREYRDKSNQWLEKTRGDLKAAAEAMQMLAQNVAANSADHAKLVKTDLQKLVTLAESEDLSHIREAIRATAESIAQSYEKMREETKLMVAQLHDEIQSLHREMDKERKALYTDPVSSAWNREKMSLRIEDLLNRGEGFCVVVLSIRNLKRLRATTSQTVLDGSLKALVKRMQGIVRADAMVGRWSDEEFIALLEVDPSTAIGLSAEMSRVLSTRYAIQENGVAQYLTLRIATVMAEHVAGMNPAKFRGKLEDLRTAMQSSAE